MELRASPFFLTAYAIAGVCALLACILSTWMMYKHLEYYTAPRVQIYIVRIILMVPIYTVDSFFSLIFKDWAMYWDLARDCYEAYLLFMFFRLLIELADGEENFVAKLEEKPQIRYATPLCCWHIKPGRIFLHRCKQMILQYVIWKPILAVATFVLQIMGIYDEGNFAVDRGYLYVTLVYNVSITLSLYFLVLFYEAGKEILKPFRPLSKFMCIKAVIFFSFWQGVGIAALVKMGWLVHGRDDWSTGEVARGLQDFLICVEMLPLTFLHFWSFGHKEFMRQMTQEEKKHVWHNFIEVANVVDVFRDTVSSLKKGPQRHVVVGDFLQIPREEQLHRVVKQGWLKKRGEDLAKIWKKRYCVLITEPLGIVYFKYNPFDDKMFPMLPENLNIPNVNIDLSKINININLKIPKFKIKARGFVDFQRLTNIRIKKKSFQVLMRMRNWKFKCTTVEERDEWVAAIYSVLPNLPREFQLTVPIPPTPAALLEVPAPVREPTDDNESSKQESVEMETKEQRPIVQLDEISDV